MRRVAGHLLDPEVPVGDARDLGQVRDRDHLRALREPLQGLRDRVRGLAADAGVDLVEDHRLPAGDRGDRERDARELAAGGGLGDRAERQARRSAGQEHRLVRAGRAGIALAQLDAELAVAHADAAQLLGDRVGERLRRGLARRAELGCEPFATVASAAARPPLRPRPGRAALERPSSARASAARASSSS